MAGDSASGGSASSDERHESGKAFDRLKKKDNVNNNKFFVVVY